MLQASARGYDWITNATPKGLAQNIVMCTQRRGSGDSRQSAQALVRAMCCVLLWDFDFDACLLGVQYEGGEGSSSACNHNHRTLVLFDYRARCRRGYPGEPKPDFRTVLHSEEIKKRPHKFGAKTA